MFNEDPKNDDANRRLARIRDRNSLRAYLEEHFSRAKPNSDCSVEAWAHSALINVKGTFDEHTDEVVEAFNNGFATAQVGWIQRWLDFEKSKPHGKQRPVMISSMEIALAEMKQPQGVVPYTVGDDAGEDD